MDYRVLKSDRLPEQISLERSTLGGYVVNWSGQFIGWMHEAVGDHWSAFQRPVHDYLPGIRLGSFPQDEAIRQIAMAAGWLDRDGPARRDLTDKERKPW